MNRSPDGPFLIRRPPPPRPDPADSPISAGPAPPAWAYWVLVLVISIAGLGFLYYVATMPPTPSWTCPPGLTLVNADGAWVCIEAVPAERTR